VTQAVLEQHRTYAEHFELKASSPLKHEWLRGRIFAMSGGTPEHSAIAADG
jgi:hypothetical protein